MRVREQKVSAILSADWGLRDDVPFCRTDDFWAAQARKVRFIYKLQEQQHYKCPILFAGDLFDRARPSHFLVRWTLAHLPKQMIVIPGQHDLPNHSLKLIKDSGLGILEQSGAVLLPKTGLSAWEDIPGCEVFGFPYGSKLSDKQPFRDKDSIKIALIHVLTSLHTSQWTATPDSILDQLSGFALVVCGDNHETFTHRNKRGQLLVSPGSLMRENADQVNHRPCVFLWYADKNSAEPVYLPIEEGVVDRSHIEEEKARDVRMEAYRVKLKAGVKIGVSFEKNMERFLAANKVKDKIKELIYLAMGDKK